MEVIYLEKVDSTNAYVKQHAGELSDRTVVYTSHQSAGRGRLDRKWIDTGSENIYMTMFLKPSDMFLEVYSNLTQYLSVVLCQTLAQYGVDASIKWPNDVLVDGKKIAGILSETSMQGNVFKGIALGIGINLNTEAKELEKIDKPAVSLSVLLGKKINRDEFLHALLDKFYLLYDRFIDEGFLLIKEEYLNHASFTGKDIRVNVLGEIHTGRAVGITDEGALVLEEDNVKHTYFIGDIL